MTPEEKQEEERRAKEKVITECMGLFIMTYGKIGYNLQILSADITAEGDATYRVHLEAKIFNAQIEIRHLHLYITIDKNDLI